MNAIGYVQVDEGNRLTLGVDLVWRSDTLPGFAAACTAMFSDESFSPSSGDPGIILLHKVANFFGGTVVIVQEPSGPSPGHVF